MAQRAGRARGRRVPAGTPGDGLPRRIARTARARLPRHPRLGKVPPGGLFEPPTPGLVSPGADSTVIRLSTRFSLQITRISPLATGVFDAADVRDGGPRRRIAPP